MFKKPTQDLKEIRSNWGVKSVSAFTVAYLLLATTMAILTKNWEFTLYIGVVLVIAAFTIVVRLYSYVSTGVLWALSVWGILHMMGGLVHIPADWPREVGGKEVLYSWWIIPHIFKFDNLVHCYGFAIATILCWQALRGTLHDITPRFGVLILCVFAAMGLGATNEIIEYIATKTLPHTNVGGYDNTVWDLIWNSIGGIGAAYLIYLTHPLLDSIRPLHRHLKK